MFTLKNNSIGKVGVYLASAEKLADSAARPATEVVKNYKEFVNKSPEKQIEEIKTMPAGDRQALESHIKSLKTSTPNVSQATKDWRESMLAAIATTINNPVVPTAPADIAIAVGVSPSTAPDITGTQTTENRAVVAIQTAEIATVQADAAQNLNSHKTVLENTRGTQGMSEQARALRTYLLGLSHDASEVNLESLVATFGKLPSQSPDKLTKEDFKKAGYNESGVIFQDKELAQLKDLVGDLRNSGNAIDLQAKLASVTKLDKVFSQLEKTNIGSLFQVLSKNINNLPPKVTNEWLISQGYTGNGAISIGERSAIEGVIKEIKADHFDQKIVSQIGNYYGRGLTAVDFRNEQNELNALKDQGEEKGNIRDLINYLSSVTIGRYQDTKIQRNLAQLSEPEAIAAIARLSGSKATTFDAMKAEFIANPSLKATFIDNLNVGLASGLDYTSVLKGDNSRLERKEQAFNASIEKAIQNAKTTANEKLANTKNPDEKAKIEAFIDELNKTDVSRFALRFRRVAEGLAMNVGKNANAIGAGASFEVMQGLTITPAVGIIDGKAGGGLALHYNVGTATLRNGEKSLTTVTGGVGVGGLTSFVPFADVSIANLDKVTTLDNRLGDVGALSLNLSGSEVGGTATIGYKIDRDSEINQTEATLRRALSSVASETSLDAPKLLIILQESGFSDTKDASSFLARINEVYASRNVNESTSAYVKAQILDGIIKSGIEKMQVSDANTTVDSRSLMGGGVGAGMILGVPFPLAYLEFYKREMVYTSNEQVDTAAPVETPAQVNVETTETMNLIESTANTEFASKIAEHTDFFRLSRGKFIYLGKEKVAFNDFQKNLIDGNVQAAYTVLDKYLRGISLSRSSSAARKSEAKVIQELIKGVRSTDPTRVNDEKQALTDINVLTSGSEYTRKLSKMTTESLAKELLSPQAKKYFSALAGVSSKFFHSGETQKAIKAMYENTAFQTALSGGLKSIDKNTLGVVAYAQKLGAARGLDGTATNARYYEGAKVTPDTQLIDDIFREYTGQKEALMKKFAITTDADMNTLLLGGNITKADGKTLDGSKIKFNIGYSAAEGATCYNAMVIMSGLITERTPGGQVIKSGGVADFGNNVESFVRASGILGGGYSEKDTTEPIKPKEPEDTSNTKPTTDETPLNPAKTNPNATPVTDSTAPENGPATGTGNNNTGNLNGAPAPTQAPPVAPTVPVAPPVSPSTVVNTPTPDVAPPAGSSGTIVGGRTRH